MKNNNKTKEQLLDKISKLEDKIAELEKSISKCKRTEEALHESEKRIRNLIESIPIGITISTPEGSILEVNTAILKIFGYDSKEELGNTHTEAHYYNPKDRERFLKLIKKGLVKDLEVQFKHKDGSMFWGSINSTMVTTGAGNTEFISSFEDITERKRAREEIKSLSKFPSENPNPVLQIDLNGVILYANKAALSVFSNWKLQVGQTIPEVLQELTQWVKGTFVRTSDIPYGERIFSFSAALLVGPGYVNIYAEDITERKLAEKELLEKNKNLELLGQTVSTMNECVSITDKEHKIIFVNHAFVKTYGYKREEIIGKTSRVLKIKENSELLNETRQKTKLGGWKGELLNKKKDGTIFPIELSVTPLRDENGNIIAQIGISIDITERKQVEKTLRENEQRYRMIHTTAFDGLITVDTKGRIVETNPRTEKMFGYGTGELVGVELICLIPESYRKRHLEGMKRVTGEGKIFGKLLELEGLRNNGNVFPIELVINSFSLNGKIQIIGAIRDITERKRAEEELKKLSVAVQQSPVSVMITDTEGNIEYVNPKFSELTGYSAEEVIGKNPNILKSGVNPESDYKELWNTIKKGETWTGELVNKKKNGELYWESSIISPLKDNNENITNYIAVNENITEKKNMISDLMNREEKYRTLTQNLNVGVYRSTSGKNGMFVEVNPAFLKMFEFRSKSELERFKVEDFYSDPFDREKIEEKLTSKGFLINEEVKLRKKDGTRFSASISATAAKDDSGKIIHFDGIIEDNTERKVMMDRIIQERDRSQLYLDIAGVMFLSLDRKGNIILANQKTCEIIGITEKNLIGKNWFDNYLPKDIQLDVKDVFNNLMDGNTKLAKFHENEILTTSGEKRLIAWHNNVRKDYSGNVIGIISSGLDVTEENKAREDILNYQSDLKSLANELIITEEEAKRRLATTLHDKLGQSLVLANFKSNELYKQTKSSEHKKLINEITSFIAEAINESRNITYELSPAVLYEMGLIPAISLKLDDIEKNNKIKTSLIDQSQSYELKEKVQIILFRTISEILQNVIKHSKADKVNVEMRLLKNSYRIIVADNGIGFDFEAMRAKAVSQKKFGLFSIMERIRYIGSEVNINAVPNKGTKIIINMPIKN